MKKTNNKRKNGVIIPINLEGKSNAYIVNESLEDLVSDVREELNIEDSLNISDELLINSSHELKTPVNIIYGAAQMIEIHMNDDKDKVLSYIDSIKNNCFRLTKHINNILDLTAIESGEYKINPERINIVEATEYIVQNIASKIKEKGINIVFDTNVEEKYVMVDSYLYGKSILNIISNAVKFSKPKGNILVNFTDYNNFIEIDIIDDGIGIDKRNLEKIFQRYGQVNKSLSKNAEGSGIGLRLAKAIVELHGGKCFVQSKLGVGSTFSFKIPLDNKDLIYNLYANDKIINYENLNEMVNIEFSDILNIG